MKNGLSAGESKRSLKVGAKTPLYVEGWDEIMKRNQPFPFQSISVIYLAAVTWLTLRNASKSRQL